MAPPVFKFFWRETVSSISSLVVERRRELIEVGDGAPGRPLVIESRCPSLGGDRLGQASLT